MSKIVDGWMLVQYLVAFVSPIVVGLVTRQSTHPGVKAVLLALISALTAVGTELLDAHSHDAPVILNVIVFNAVVGFTIAVASHFGLWKPTGVSAGAQNTLVKG